MKAREILLITFLFIAGFMVSEIIIANFMYIGALKRFLLRLAFMFQYSVIIYLLSSAIGSGKKSEENEENDEEHRDI